MPNKRFPLHIKARQSRQITSQVWFTFHDTNRVSFTIHNMSLPAAGGGGVEGGVGVGLGGVAGLGGGLKLSQIM